MTRKLFAFNEVPLWVPETWNLRTFNGNAVQGSFFLDDGKAPVLLATWEPAGIQSLDERETRLIKAAGRCEIRKQIEIDKNSRIVLLRYPSGEQRAFCLLLQPERSRYLWLQLMQTSGDLQGTTRTLIKPLPDYECAPAQPWRFFSTAFSLPSGFLLKEADLKLGCAHLSFTQQKVRLVLWDLSLMDRVAKEQPLAVLARTLAEKQFPKRYRFPAPDPDAAPDASFDTAGKIRFHWRLSPYSWLFGNNKVRLHGVPNPARNHYTIVLQEYRHEDDAKQIDPLITSLRTLQEEETA